MRLGLNDVPKHSSPEEWAEILANAGYRAASFPVDYHAPVSVIDAYVKAARERDILIAEVGVWNSPNRPDEEGGKVCAGGMRGAVSAGGLCPGGVLCECVRRGGTDLVWLLCRKL